MLQSGLAALVDVTGALATSCGITGGVTLATPDGGWVYVSNNNTGQTHAMNADGTHAPAPTTPAGPGRCTMA